jgi:hypothetical protein
MQRPVFVNQIVVLQEDFDTTMESKATPEDSDCCTAELLVFVKRDSTSKLNVGFTGQRVFIVRGDRANSIQYMVRSDVKMLRSSVWTVTTRSYGSSKYLE